MIEQLAALLREREVDLDTISVVFDIGSRDGLQALELAQLLREADVVAIECNTQSLEQCRRNVAKSARIRLIEKAINSFTGRCPFYPIDPERTVTTWHDGNPGASSLFIANGEYPIEQYVQNETEVECIRLDDLSRQLGIDVIDVIWMDLQGAELLALQSAGNLLDKVRYIYTEVSHRPLYRGQCLFEDVDAFLAARGFRRCTAVDRSRWQQDLIYENTRDLIDVVIPIASDDGDGAEFAARSAGNFIAGARHVYVVSAEDPQLHGTRFVNQSQFPFDIQAISRLLSPSQQPELYWRQLVRLHFPLVHRASLRHVLAMEPQTVFLRPCQFVRDGLGVFTFGDEYRSADFEHMARLYPALHRMFAYSGAAGCMLFSRAWLKELHEAVEAHHGMPFWQAYLQALDPGKGDRGASDYEIYLNFSLMFHAWELIIRGLRRSRITSPDEIQPDWLDLVSVEGDLARSPIAREQFESLFSRNPVEGADQTVRGFLATAPAIELGERP